MISILSSSSVCSAFSKASCCADSTAAIAGFSSFDESLRKEEAFFGVGFGGSFLSVLPSTEQLSHLGALTYHDRFQALPACDGFEASEEDLLRALIFLTSRANPYRSQDRRERTSEAIARWEGLKTIMVNQSSKVRELFRRWQDQQPE